MKKIFEQIIEKRDISNEDGGMARIVELGVLPDEPDNDRHFVRLQSWDEKKRHGYLNSIEGKRVRVTVEVLDQTC